MKILKLKVKRIAEPKDPYGPGSFNTDDLFDLDLTVIQTASRYLFGKLKILVGEIPQIADPVSSPQIDVVMVSSHYASAAEDGSDTSSEPQRMSLGPSGAVMLEATSRIRRPSPARSSSQPKGSTPTDQATITSSSDRSVGTLHKFFNAAMDRFLAEQQAVGADPVVKEMPDREMSTWSRSDHQIVDPTGNTIRTTSTPRHPPKRL
ncbi:hypothetical protein PHMEG_00040371, partial [Phytophthora megakarya]